MLYRDIVDEEYWCGDFLKILLGSINPDFDDDDDDVLSSNSNGLTTGPSNSNSNGHGNGTYHKDYRI